MRRIVGAIIFALTCLAGSAHGDEAVTEISSVGRESGLSAKWQAAQRLMSEDEAKLAACRADAALCGDGERRLGAIVASAQSREGRARIGDINRAVNLSIRPASDERRFGVLDRWSGPLETIGAGEGDCEDYAILKLMALREAGIARDDLKLLIVWDRMNAHAVAAVRLDGRWLILDNRTFVLVDLEWTHYRVLAQLAPDADGPRYAGLDADAPLDVM
jgi:predicted transglutaminase-like cysteine proteinase